MIPRIPTQSATTSRRPRKSRSRPPNEPSRSFFEVEDVGIRGPGVWRKHGLVSNTERPLDGRRAGRSRRPAAGERGCTGGALRAKAGPHRMEFRLASLAFIAVFAAYLFLGGMGVTDRGNPNPRDAPYNLLARGLLSGHLYLDKEAPPFLAHLADPYDPMANRDARDVRDRLNDLSYYRGRLYLYFGIAPALFVFVPWHLLTGGWLAHWIVVVVLCSAG